jgi:hypothetical protein
VDTIQDIDSAMIAEKVTVVGERPASRALSNKLRLLLNGELCNHLDSHSNLETAGAMWKKSRELDETIGLVWEKESKRIQQVLGEQYRDIDDVLGAWLNLYRGARTIGELAECHPLENNGRALEQWVNQLGAEPDYAQMDFKLTHFRLKLEHSWIYQEDQDMVADKLTRAFAAATQHPNAATLFRSSIASFNEKLFSWVLDC